MSVRIIYDTDNELAALYCSTSEVAFGPVFSDTNDWPADARAEAFLRWLSATRAIDARRLPDAELLRAYSDWLAQETAQWAAEDAAEDALR